MSINQPGSNSSPSSAPFDRSPPPQSPSSESLSVSLGLQHIGSRLTAIEAAIEKASQISGPKATPTIELLKILFGGWPALGFLFLLLFYVPLRDALNTIPEKVRSAEEIGVLGVSLKSTIRAEAARLNAADLSKTIPTLSPGAIEMLLQAGRNTKSLLGYAPQTGNRQQIIGVYIPSKKFLLSLYELQSNGLVKLEIYSGLPQIPRDISGSEVDALIAAFKSENPGHESTYRPGTYLWKLVTPLLDETKLPSIQWELTILGKKAVDIVLKAVATELAPSKS